ncbi:hypothetical protein FRC01_002313, partial [Tulasnella sp. 417]
LALVLKLAVRFLQQSGTKVLDLAWDLLKTLLARCRVHRSANQDTTPSPLLNSDLGTQDASASAAPDPPKDHPPQFGHTKTPVPQLDVPEPRATAHPLSLEFDSTEGTAPAQMDSPNLVSPTTDASALHQPNFEPTRPSFRGYVKEPGGTPSAGGSYSDIWRCPIRFITPSKEHPTEAAVKVLRPAWLNSLSGPEGKADERLQRGEPLLADFGLATILSEEKTYTPSHGGGGSVPWMAPECIAGEPRSLPSDVYSFGRSPANTGGQTPESDGEPRDMDIRICTLGDRKIAVKSQVEDYRLRGDGIPDLGLFFFLLRTYETRKEERDDVSANLHGNQGERHRYQSQHPRADTHIRVGRNPDREVMPEFIGPWFPRRDDPTTRNLYCASMLMLFKPWTSLQELKGESFEMAFAQYLGTCPKRERDIMDNIQWYYETADGAAEYRKRDAGHSMAAAFDISMEDDSDEESSNDQDHRADAELERDEEDTGNDDFADLHGCSPPEWRNGKVAVDIGQSCSLLSRPDQWESAPILQPRKVTESDTTRWKEEVDRLTEFDPQTEDILDEETGIWVPRPVPPTVEVKGPSEKLVGTILDELSEDQRRAVGILDDHLCDTLAGREPEQLLMLVIGEAGTGKSRVIQAMTWVFEQRGLLHLLAKAGSTGVASNLIGGSTFHHLMVVPPVHPTDRNTHPPSESTKNKREQHLRNKRYVLGDEISMLPQEFISVASSAVGNAHAGLTGSSSLRPFGGIMNNIFFGDYHQFLPVRHENTALYKRTVPNAYAASGRGIMEQFTTVVLLTEQKRVPANSRWAQILSRARFGACNEEDIRFMKDLVLTNPSCAIPDFREPGWSSAVL